MTIKIDVAEQFLTRPTLRDVATEMLRDALSKKYPALSIEPEVAVVSGPPLSSEHANTAGRLMTLTDCLLENFSSQRPWHFAQGQHVLVAQPSAGEWMPLAVEMADISALLDRLSLVLIDGFEQATADYLCQPSTTGISRWEWLSDRLKQQLREQVIAGAFAQLTDTQRNALSAVATCADKAQRNALLGATPDKANDDLRACIAYLNVSKEDESSDEPLPAIVLVGHTAGDEIVIVYRPSGEVESYSSQDQLGASLGARLSKEWNADQLQWTLYEPEGNIFEALTQVLLEKQLNTLQALKGADSYDLESLEQHLASATDLSRMFDAPGSVNAQVPTLALEALPEWLQHASITDRLDYGRYLAALAVEQKRSNGQSFNDDLPSITDFTLRTLRLKVLEDHPDASDLSLDDIEVVIDKVTAAALPSGGQIVSVGGVERVRMTLSEFALENLSSLPYGSITLHRASARPMPDWFSVDYLKALTARANIGQAYPHLLERSLITDTEEAQRRQALFASQLRIQLPLKALEQKIKGEGGLSEAGYRSIAAVMKASGERKVGTHGIVIRPLAFVSPPGASADVVSNMFVIGPEEVAAGPHVLYRAVRQSVVD